MPDTTLPDTSLPDAPASGATTTGPLAAPTTAPDGPPPGTNRWRGVPSHERQAERRRLLVAAAFEALGTVGAAGTTVRGVCEAAKLNPRYFYESFPDLDALIVAVYDEVATEAFAAMVGAATEAAAGTSPAALDPLALTRATIGTFVRHVTADPRRARVLFLEGLGHEALSRRRFESMGSLTDLLLQDAAARADIEPGTAARVAANLTVGGMTELMIAWLHGRLDVGLDELIDHTAALFVAIGTTAHELDQR